MKQLSILLLAVLFSITSAYTQTNHVSEIKRLMQQSATDWNNANLDGFMALYDTAATFMFSTGPVGLDKMRANYERGFFKGGKPIQQLRFEDLEVRMLGTDHALLTGKFILWGNNLPDRKGIYSLVFVKRNGGWKILHDHSS